jgi:hypothetical protein
VVAWWIPSSVSSWIGRAENALHERLAMTSFISLRA